MVARQFEVSIRDLTGSKASFADLLVSLGAATLVDAVQAAMVLEDVQVRADYTADCAVDLAQEEPAQIHYGEFG